MLNQKANSQLMEMDKSDKRRGRVDAPCLTAPSSFLRSTVKAWGPMDSPIDDEGGGRGEGNGKGR